MKFEKHTSTEQLKPFIKYFVVSEIDDATEYKVFPSSGLVIGFQYRGRLSAIKSDRENTLAPSGITGITDGYKIFRNVPNCGTIPVHFTEVGFVHFATHPAHELFDLSISLDHVFDQIRINEGEEKLVLATMDKQRIHIVEQFLLSQRKDIRTDGLIIEAVKLIHESKGAIQIKELNKRPFISQSPFEKRFRKTVGATPKRFASIVRFNSVLQQLNIGKTPIDVCYENKFFDHAHFSKDFKHYTGDTPENFKRLL